MLINGEGSGEGGLPIPAGRDPVGFFSGVFRYLFSMLFSGLHFLRKKSKKISQGCPEGLQNRRKIAPGMHFFRVGRNLVFVIPYSVFKGFWGSGAVGKPQKNEKNWE